MTIAHDLIYLNYRLEWYGKFSLLIYLLQMILFKATYNKRTAICHRSNIYNLYSVHNLKYTLRRKGSI